MDGSDKAPIKETVKDEPSGAVEKEMRTDVKTTGAKFKGEVSCSKCCINGFASSASTNSASNSRFQNIQNFRSKRFPKEIWKKYTSKKLRTVWQQWSFCVVNIFLLRN